jgi:hypothetical protein
MREGGAARKWPALSGRCSCNASDPECHETQQGWGLDSPENPVLLVTPQKLIPYDPKASLNRVNQM